MSEAATSTAIRQELPRVTGMETRAHLLTTRAVRPSVPIRKTFVQKHKGANPRHGPLRDFVATGDLRGLRAYLIALGATSAENTDGWTTTHESIVWARLFDADKYANPQSARTAAWRTLLRLQDRGLITCKRVPGSKKISVTLLCEDGSGSPYTRPDGKLPEDRFINLPRRLWTKGYDEKLKMPGLAMLLTIAREKPWSSFPADRADEWYGWSADTTLRGLKELVDLGLVERRENYRKTPLSPTGYTLSYQYRLVPWMRPKARRRPITPAQLGGGT
jgi:hypothetical protein